VLPPVRPPKPGVPGHPTADPFRGLGFPVPLSEAAYNALPPARRQQLQDRLATFDCASDQPDGEQQRTTALLACDSPDPAKATMAYLLGGPLHPAVGAGPGRRTEPLTASGPWA